MKKAVYYILTFLMKREWLISILADKEEKILIALKKEGYLYDMGWMQSMLTGKIVDRQSNPLPWVTYPFIEFIDNRLNNNLDVFEFGSGNSTFYYAAKAHSVTTVENDEVWYDKIKQSLPSNAEIHYSKLENGGDYCNYAVRSNKKYDMIIVDGRDRVNCCINNLGALKLTGVLILDDSERQRYQPGVAFLLENGLKRIDFWGTAPAVNYLKCTTLFYRDNNCLGV